MGIYLNPGNEQFAVSVNSELYVDKTELIKYTNSRIGKDRPLICSSRPRRFGKTMAVTMLAAYYSKGCNSEKLFAKFKISQNEFFKKHLNKYNVLLLDIQWMYGNALEEMKRNPFVKIVSYFQEQVIGELKKEYPECVQDTDISLPSVLANINAITKEQFIIIIDEWDCLFREDKNNEQLQKEYINLLRGLFKGTPSGAFLKLAYITGILPIKKYGTQSALNNFREHTMVSPRQMAEYVGFTEIEVKDLCKEHGMPFREMPAGNGFSDMVFLPKRTSSKPALVLELKWDKTAEGAISQIKNKKYVSALKEYKGNILLVGINYEKKSKKHQCRIEKFEI